MQRWLTATPTILVAALLVRLGVWLTLPYTSWISDEGEYWATAVWLAEGRGLSFLDGWVWTRPPLYIGFLAVHAKLFGATALWAPRLSQALLGVLAVWLVMKIAERLAPEHARRSVAVGSGWLMALSYSFASFAYFLLSETLFLALFLAAVWLLLRWAGAPTWRGLALAAVALGLTALTRAIVLTWLPLVALWVAWVLARQAAPGRSLKRTLAVAWRPALGGTALLTAVICVVVFPWTTYATLRWGGGDGVILVDTTGGYNWALGAMNALPEGRDGNKLHDLLCGSTRCDEAQTSHAGRQALAYAQGWEWISDHPTSFVRKTGRELLDMLQLRYGGAERLNSGYTLGFVPIPHLLGLAFDDAWYVAVLLLGVVGLWRPQGRLGKGLILGWLLYNVAVGAAVFAINRFRQPLLPFLAIYAVCALVSWRQAWPDRRRWASLATAGALAVVVLPSFLWWPQALDPNRRSTLYDTYLGVRGRLHAAECAEIRTVFETGQVADARRLHDAADARAPRPCLALINAKILEAEGRIDEALALLRSARPVNEAAQASRVLLLEGDLYRRLGDLQRASEIFIFRDVETMNDLQFAWEWLEPPPTTRIDLGGGLDFGYLLGFYSRDQGEPTFRWSGPTSQIRFPEAGTGRPQTLVLRVNGYTTNPTPTQVVPSFGGVALPPLVLAPGWQEVTVALPPSPPGGDVIVSFASDVFVPGPFDLEQRVRTRVREELRLLGFQLDWAALREE